MSHDSPPDHRGGGAREVLGASLRQSFAQARDSRAGTLARTLVDPFGVLDPLLKGRLVAPDRDDRVQLATLSRVATRAGGELGAAVNSLSELPVDEQREALAELGDLLWRNRAGASKASRRIAALLLEQGREGLRARKRPVYSCSCSISIGAAGYTHSMLLPPRRRRDMARHSFRFLSSLGDWSRSCDRDRDRDLSSATGPSFLGSPLRRRGLRASASARAASRAPKSGSGAATSAMARRRASARLPRWRGRRSRGRRAAADPKSSGAPVVVRSGARCRRGRHPCDVVIGEHVAQPRSEPWRRPHSLLDDSASSTPSTLATAARSVRTVSVPAPYCALMAHPPLESASCVRRWRR